MTLYSGLCSCRACLRYSLLHLAGYDSVAMDDLKQFRPMHDPEL